MKLRSTVAALGVLLGGHRGLAAQAITQPVELKPKACAASDSLIGPAPQFGKARVTLASPPDRSMTILMTQATPTTPRGTPLQSVNFMLQYEGRSAPAARLNMQFNVVDSVLRVGSAAELTLVLDDSLTWRLGPTRVDSHIGGKPNRVPQGLSTSLTPEESRRFAQAGRVQGRIGTTEFEFTREQLAAARAVLAAAVCGQSK